MNAPVKTCLFCLKSITDRSYRSLSSTTSKEHYKDVYNLISISETNGFACSLCMTKLNRIAKLNDDMRTKYFVIKQERDKLVSIMKDTPGMKNCSK